MFSSNGSQVSSSVNYVDDVFSTHTYIGNGVSQPIINDIALGSTAAWSTQTLVHSANNVYTNDTVTDSSGNIYEVGTSSSYTGFVVKYNSSFAVQWHKVITPSPYTCSMTRVTVDSSGNVFVVGYINDGAGEGQLVLFKFNSSGTLQWQTQLGTARTAYPYGISVDSSGNIRVSGHVQQATSVRSMLLKFASNGTLTWQRHSVNTGVEANGKHAVDSSGNTYVGLYTYGGDYHSFGVLQKWDTDGNLTWQRSIDLPSWGGGLTGGVVIDSAGSIYTAGGWNVTGTSSAVLAKYNSSGTLQWRRYYYINAAIETGGRAQGIATDGTYIYLNVYANNTHAGYTYPVTLFKIDNTGATVAKTGIFHKASSNFSTGGIAGSLTVSPDASTLYAGGYVTNTLLSNKVQGNIIAIPTAFGVSGKALYNLDGGGFHLDAVWSSGTEAAASLTTGTSSYTTSTPTYSFSNASNFTSSSENQSAVIGSGGLAWIKWQRAGSLGSADHALFDTNRGVQKNIATNTTDAEATNSGLTAFNTNGFNLGSGSSQNSNLGEFVSWTFRKQPKFFDIVTYTGNSTSGRLIPHSLGSAPGAIIIKSSSYAGTNWAVWHRSLGSGYALQLQSTSAAFNTKTQWFNSSAQGSSTTFEVGNDTDTNEAGHTFVAYLFAHNAGGFGLTGADNVISCGVYEGNGSTTGPVITLGYEPQWLMIKNASGTSDWVILDNMRGIVTDGVDPRLFPNTSGAENTGDNQCKVTATGFQPESISNIVNTSSNSYIYIAIRKGGMQIPTDATKVFIPIARNGTGANTEIIAGFAPDMAIAAYRTAGEYMPVVDKLRGPKNWLTWQQLIIQAENSGYGGEWFKTFTPNGMTVGPDNSGGKSVNTSGTNTSLHYYFKRAAGYMDIVCYTGGGASTITHNLKAVPELMIVKKRSSTVSNTPWVVYSAALGNGKVVGLAGSAAAYDDALWDYTTPTASQFSVRSTLLEVNYSAATYVAYLFATCPGVSKVGSYTGTGTTLQIDCGFTNGARFVFLKRTDSTGIWYIWDTARGIVSGNDPYISTSQAAEETGSDYIDPYSAGFEISSSAPTAINASGGTYIFLAIA